METIQDDDNEADQDPIARLHAHCLSTPEILRTVLEKFSNNELLQLSLVNKLWEFEARFVLKSRNTLIATSTQNSTCEDLHSFALHLQRMRVVPFVGMHLKLGGQHSCACQEFSAHELDVVCNEILERINWRILSVHFDEDWDKHQICPGFVLLKKILLKFGSALQEFSLLVEQNRVDLIQIFLQGFTFSNLKVLKFQDEYLYAASDDYTNLIKELVSHAPNLQTLYTRGLVNLRADLLKGSSAVHVTDYPFSPSLGEIPKAAVGSLRMKQMKLTAVRVDFIAKIFNKTFFNLLEVSRTTLTWMHIDVMFLLPLTASRISLKNVRTLKIDYDSTYQYSVTTAEFWNHLKSVVDLDRTFPNLDTVEFNGYRGSNTELHLVQRQFMWVNEGGGVGATKVKNLSVNWTGPVLAKKSTQFLADIFPNVERLSIRAKGVIPWEVIWHSWLQVEELDVTIAEARNSSSLKLDSAFCGIFPEEVAQLRGQGEEYLTRVNIVPVTPSVANLKHLRTLAVCFQSCRFKLEGGAEDLLSKVTPLIAFKRCQNLAVTLKTNDENLEKALRHMKPYVSVVLDNEEVNLDS